jgi:hypothetical protein
LLLNDISKTNEINDFETVSNYRRALRYFGKLFNKTPPKLKHTILYPMKMSGLGLSKSKSLGFKATSWMWESCLSNHKRSKGGRKLLKENEQTRINLFMESISSIAANRYLKKIEENAFNCDVSLIEAFGKFENINNISFSSFYKYVNEKFKNLIG